MQSVIKLKEMKETSFLFLRRTSCDPNLTYIVTGGLGGFGLELCDWLVRRGARHIIITTRSGKLVLLLLCFTRTYTLQCLAKVFVY